MILVVAATERELRGAAGAGVRSIVCGVGPVEAAARTARALAETGPAANAILHVGLAGVRGFAEPELVLGDEARYCDADDARWIQLSTPPDAGLLAAARRAFPRARIGAIGTTARVGGSTARTGGSTACAIEAMEGYAVLRAAALAGVPALEVRALANEIDEPDRARWRFDEAHDLLAAALPALLEELARAHA